MARLISYSWSGKNKNNEILSGTLEASSYLSAKIELSERGIFIKKIRRKYFHIKKRSKKIKLIDIAYFTRQLAILMSSNIPLIQLLEIMKKSDSKPSMKIVLQTIIHNLERGLSFGEALQEHPHIFNAMYCKLIAIGEKSSTLSFSLLQIANYQEKIVNIRKIILKALLYPTVVLLFAFIVGILLLLFVIPQFELLFKEFNTTLPYLTQTIIKLSQSLKKYPFIIFLTSIILCFLLQFIFNSSLLKSFVDKSLLRIPRFKNIAISLNLLQFSTTLAISLKGGVSILEALYLTQVGSMNESYAQAICEIQKKLLCGYSLVESMTNHRLFPPLALQFIQIGEESNRLEFMLEKIAAHFEDEVNNYIATFNILLEPLIMAFLGIVIGSLILSIYLPVIKLGEIV